MEGKIKRLMIATIILGFIVLGLGGYIIYDKFVVKPMPKTEEKKKEKEEAKEYKKGDIITFSDETKWLVLEDSDKNSDTVKLMYTKDLSEHHNYMVIVDELYQNLVSEYFNSNTVYKGSEIESYVNTFAEKLPVKVKEVDGYKVRLLSIEDIKAYDSNWNKVNDNKYIYAETGKGLPDEFWGAWLMDVVGNKCNGEIQEDGRCAGNMSVFFNVRLNEDQTNVLEPGSSGLAEVKPVIYVYKDSIK